MFDYAEKRDFLRLAVECPAKIRLNGARQVEDARVKNISGGGLVLQAAQDIPRGSEVSIVVSPVNSPMPPLVAAVKVVRSEPELAGAGYLVSCSIDRVLENRDME